MSLRDMGRLLSLLLVVCVTSVYAQNSGCSGQCISIRECPNLLTLLQQIQSGNAPSGSLEILRSSICRFDNNTPFVCCSTSFPGTLTLPVVGSPGNIVPTRSNLLPTQCGRRPLVDRIVGGEPAPLRAWPWIALLEAATGSGSRSSVICGGTLISERYVLTAAHCVDPKIAPKLTKVRLGEHTLSQNPDCVNNDCVPPYQSFGVEDIIIHESYGIPRQCSRCNDIALIRLDRPVQFNSLSVQPVCLPQNFQSDLGFPKSSLSTRQAWVAGWGITDFRSVSPANVLQQVLLNFDESLCSLDYQVFPDRNMALCAGGNRQDTCRGDSGGPMVLANVGQTQHYLVGIVSKGPVVCGAVNTGGLYTSVDFYVPWITQKLRH